MKTPKIKRCKSTSAMYPKVRCTKERGHVDSLLNYTHSNGALFWNEPMGRPAPFAVRDEAISFSFIPFGPTPPLDSHADANKLRGLLKETATDEYQATPTFTPMSRAEEELRGWWFDQATAEVDGTVPKALEYSATDLADIGHVLARCMGRTVDDEEAAELGIFFYLQGKLSRWAGAVQAGKRPSNDTIYDIGVYCRMAQRVRATGGWPGTNLEDM